MKIDVQHWPAISALFDQALDLPEEQRRPWLDELPEGQRAHRHTLELLLNDHAHVETQNFLQSLPKVGVAPETAPPIVAEGERMVGPYRLLRELGRGGMGSVWLAERADGLLKREVALKLPHEGLATRAFAERLVRERDILASLVHPHIASLYDAGVTAQGQPYIALAYVAGCTLIEHCKAQELGVRESVALFQQVLQAVQYAHAHLVIHRDLKPGNVLVDERGQVHLLDFGIAKLLVDGKAEATDLTLDAGQALTPDYASPEQIAGGAISIASDVYSLGVLLYEVLAGQRPYRLPRLERAALLQAVLDLEVPVPSTAVLKANPAGAGGAQPTNAQRQRAHALRGDLDTIVLTAMKKRPDERYATVQALQDDLQRHLAGEVVQARPDRLTYRTLRFVQRHRLPVAASATVMVAVLAGAGASLWEADQARKQAARAESEAAAVGAVGDFMLRTFSRIAADPTISGVGGRQALAGAMRAELAKVEVSNRGNAKALAAVSGHAAAMFNYLQSQSETLAWALKQLQYLRQAGEPPIDIAEAERMVALGYYRGGEHDKALEHLHSGLAVLPPAAHKDTRVLRARLWRASGSSLTSEGRYAEARTALEVARRELEPDLREVNQFYGAASIDLARVLDELGDDHRPQALLDEVRTIFARQPGLADSEWGGLEWGQGVLLLNQARYAEAESALRKASALYGTQFGSDGWNAAGIDALIARAVGKQGRYGEAIALLDHALPILQRGPSWRLLERALHARAELDLDRGDLAHAAQSVAQVQAQVQGRPQSRVWAILFEARLASASGRHAAAQALISEAQTLSEQVFKEAQRTRHVLGLAAAEIDLAAGNVQAAR